MLNTTISFLRAYGLGTKLVIFVKCLANKKNARKEKGDDIVSILTISEIFWTCLVLEKTLGVRTIIYPILPLTINFLEFFSTIEGI